MSKTRKVSGRKRYTKHTRRGKRGGYVQLNTDGKQIANDILKKLKEIQMKLENPTNPMDVGYTWLSRCSMVSTNQMNPILSFQTLKRSSKISEIKAQLALYEEEQEKMENWRKSFGRRFIKGLASLEKTRAFLDEIFEKGSVSIACQDIKPMIKRFEKLSS